MDGAVTVVSVHEEINIGGELFKDRLVPLEDNPMMLPIMDPCKDVVKRDIDDIPRILHDIQEDWKARTCYYPARIINTRGL
jgi:hypothetical protein